MLEVRTSYLELVAGRIEEVDGECIATHFFAPFALPLFPQRSIYLKSEVREARRQMTHFGESIPLVWRSVVLGYLRVWLGWLFFTSPWILMWGESLDFSRPEWLVTLGLFVAWIFVLVVPGRLSKRERLERQVLYRATGLHLPPKYLRSFDLEETTEELKQRLEEAGVDTSPAGLASAASGATEGTARTLFAYARYASLFHRDRGAYGPIAEAAWARLPDP